MQPHGYATTYRTFPCGLGSLISNLLNVEFSLRVSLHLDEPKERHMPHNTFKRAAAGDAFPLNRLTSWATLGELVVAFNAGQRARGGALVDETIVNLRDMLAHGRITQQDMDSEYMLIRFGRPVGDRVPVESVQAVTVDWLEERVRETYAAGRIVWARIDEQRKTVA